MKLCIALATRKRPELLARTIETTLEHRRTGAKFLILLDDDDTAGIEAAIRYENHVTLSIRPREDTLGGKYNRAMFEPADLYLTMVDYAPHVTPGFDEKIVEAASLFPDGIGVVYNHMANASFPHINAVTRKLAEMMGFIYPPYFPYWFVDHWLDDIARMIDRISFADVHTESSRRPGTMEMREPAFWATFFDAAYLVRRQCARHIIQSPEFNEPAWRKKILLAHHPLIEYRSRWVNQQVRHETENIISMPPDERYTRVKDRAEAMIRAMLPGLQREWRRLAA